MQRFSVQYKGRLLTETMLVGGLNDAGGSAAALALFLATLSPAVAYVAVPTRPPAESGVGPPCDEAVLATYECLAARVRRVELLTADEQGSFGAAGDPVADLLGILAVHPMREEAARRYLEDAGAGEVGLDGLLADRRISRVDYRGSTFLLRRRTGGPR